MSRTEKAQYATNLRAIRRSGFGRLYFGAEFCQWRMPAASSVVRACERAAEYGMGFTLLTPWVTDAGLGKLVTAFRALDELAGSGDMKKPEVVVNDFGVLLTLAEMRLRMTPVLGRLLTRQKRCPRIPGIMEGLPEEGRGLYLGAGISDPVSAKALRGFGIKRVELDNPLQGMDVDLRSVGLKGTLYTPYAYVTVTRHCPASYDGSGWSSFTGCRTKACVNNVMEMRNPAHEEPLVMRGNTQFVRNESLPEGIDAMGIDRVVYMEDVP